MILSLKGSVFVYCWGSVLTYHKQIDDEVGEAAKAAPVTVSAKEKPSILEALKSGAEKSKSLYSGKAEPEKKAEICI